MTLSHTVICEYYSYAIVRETYDDGSRDIVAGKYVPVRYGASYFEPCSDDALPDRVKRMLVKERAKLIKE